MLLLDERPFFDLNLCIFTHEGTPARSGSLHALALSTGQTPPELQVG